MRYVSLQEKMLEGTLRLFAVRVFELIYLAIPENLRACGIEVLKKVYY